METVDQYEVEFREDVIKKDKTGAIVHHPLNGVYTTLDGRDKSSHGYLTFGGHDLDKSSILDDVKVFHLEFWGEPEETHDREEWADPLRAVVLDRLTANDRCWYLSMIKERFIKIREALTRIIREEMNSIEVESEKPNGYGYGFIKRMIIEVPNRVLYDTVRIFWAKAVPGYPIEGYNLETGQLELLRQWNARPRDDRLFRDVIDRAFVSFYTFPAEHCNFAFVTNKLDYAKLAGLIGLEELQIRVREIGREKR